MAENKGDIQDKTTTDTSMLATAATPLTSSNGKSTLETVSEEEMALLETIRKLKLEAGGSSTIKAVIKKLADTPDPHTKMLTPEVKGTMPKKCGGQDPRHTIKEVNLQRG